jgi:hypothetical protein
MYPTITGFIYYIILNVVIKVKSHSTNLLSTLNRSLPCNVLYSYAASSVYYERSMTLSIDLRRTTSTVDIFRMFTVVTQCGPVLYSCRFFGVVSSISGRQYILSKFSQPVRIKLLIHEKFDIIHNAASTTSVFTLISYF